MSWTPGEIAGLSSTAVLAIVLVALQLAQYRRRMKLEQQALGDALAASEAVSAALSEEALFLEAVLSAVDSVIVMFDRSDRVRFVNEQFDVVFGVRGSDVVGRSRAHFIELIGPCFEKPERFSVIATETEEERASGPRSTRSSGVAAPDEVEVAIVAPRPRALLFSTRPVVRGERKIGVLAVFRDVTAQRAAEEQRERLLAELAARATTDALTGVRNRRAAAEALGAEIARARRDDRCLSVVLVDIDNFKLVNDELGHEAGDRVLRAFGEVLQKASRSTDIVARWGGEEFLAILPEADLEAGRAFAERVRGGLAEAKPLKNKPVTVSAGATVLTKEDDADGVVRRADTAMYDAKHQGRDRVVARA
ncbi:MAG: diguanylate cyclase [Polyangiales bacterium]